MIAFKLTGQNENFGHIRRYHGTLCPWSLNFCLQPSRYSGRDTTGLYVRGVSISAYSPHAILAEIPRDFMSVESQFLPTALTLFWPRYHGTLCPWSLNFCLQPSRYSGRDTTGLYVRGVSISAYSPHAILAEIPRDFMSVESQFLPTALTLFWPRYHGLYVRGVSVLQLSLSKRDLLATLSTESRRIASKLRLHGRKVRGISVNHESCC